MFTLTLLLSPQGRGVLDGTVFPGRPPAFKRDERFKHCNFKFGAYLGFGS
jgi:hypothetical protein